MSPPLLELNEFCVSYGEAQAVHRVALRVNEGEIVAVIGP
ncbi:MAG: ABC transporter ATP-binding protein, partial [Polaromonas sp.]|nr:ABC transporter ATP-binding protein [Polaromonas sp.]